MRETPDAGEILEVVKAIVKLIDKYAEDGKTGDQARIIMLLKAYYRLEV